MLSVSKNGRPSSPPSWMPAFPPVLVDRPLRADIGRIVRSWLAATEPAAARATTTFGRPTPLLCSKLDCDPVRASIGMMSLFGTSP
jgi:hypothetical protein